jgi:hypothetical protein
MATYYSSTTFTTAYWVGRGSVDFSASEISYPFGSYPLNTSFSVRWSGLILPLSYQVFTVYGSIFSANDNIRLWIDNILVFDTSQLLAGTEANGTVSFQSTKQYYGIVVEYKHISGIAGAQLKWFNALVSDKAIISVQSLFSGTDIVGSPFVLSVSTLLSNQPDTATSAVSTDFTTFITSINDVVTAGVPENLLVYSVDSYGNSLLNICVGQPGLFCPAFPFSIFAVPDLNDKSIILATATFQTSFVNEAIILTKSGNYNIYVQLLNQSGLKITSYRDCNASYPSTSTATNNQWTQNGAFDPSYWSNISVASCLKYAGVFFPPQSGLLQFHIGGFAVAQLRVDDRLLVAARDGIESFSEFFRVDATASYSFSLDVHSNPGQNESFLFWRILGQFEFMPILNKFLFSGSAVLTGSPVRILVIPSNICAGTCMIQGIGATISFVSKSSQFYIIAKDEYSNRLSSGGQFFSFGLTRNITSESSRSLESVYVPRDFELSDLLNGTYSMVYRINETAEMPYTLDIGLPGGIGLEATYYIPEDSGEISFSTFVCVHSTFWKYIDFSSSTGSGIPQSLPKSSPFKVRWSGFILPQSANLYTIYAEVASLNDSILVWIDNDLVVNLLQNVSNAEGNGTFSFTTPSRYYDISVEYMHKNGNAGARLSWQSAFVAKSPLTSSDLFQKWQLFGTPTALHVHGFWTYVSLSQSSVAGGTQVLINGFGFDENQNYSLILSGNDTATALPVYPITNNVLVVYTPTWSSDNNRLMNVSFSADGKDYVRLYTDNQNTQLTGKCLEAIPNNFRHFFFQELSYIHFVQDCCFPYDRERVTQQVLQMLRSLVSDSVTRE